MWLAAFIIDGCSLVSTFAHSYSIDPSECVLTVPCSMYVSASLRLPEKWREQQFIVNVPNIEVNTHRKAPQTLWGSWVNQSDTHLKLIHCSSTLHSLLLAMRSRFSFILWAYTSRAFFSPLKTIPIRICFAARTDTLFESISTWTLCGVSSHVCLNFSKWNAHSTEAKKTTHSILSSIRWRGRKKVSVFSCFPVETRAIERKKRHIDVVGEWSTLYR